MSTYTYPRYTATRTPQKGWEYADCRRCGINFNTRNRLTTDRTHCTDCKHYARKENR
jgi:hypothetical protein